MLCPWQWSVAMTEQVINSWWFAASDKLPHGDNRKVIIGKTHSLRGDIVICRHALHGSIHPFDALRYATGPYLYKVEQWGDISQEKDKVGSRYRKYIAKHDVTQELRLFASQQALSVIHLWDAPNIVKEYLNTNNELIRAAARDAIRAAIRAAAWDAAWVAVRDAARAASMDAARAASMDATRAAAWDAAWDAARAAARAAARVDFLKLIEGKFNVHN